MACTKLGAIPFFVFIVDWRFFLTFLGLRQYSRWNAVMIEELPRLG